MPTSVVCLNQNLAANESELWQISDVKPADFRLTADLSRPVHKPESCREYTGDQLLHSQQRAFFARVGADSSTLRDYARVPISLATSSFRMTDNNRSKSACTHFLSGAAEISRNLFETQPS